MKWPLVNDKNNVTEGGLGYWDFLKPPLKQLKKFNFFIRSKVDRQKIALDNSLLIFF